MKVKFITAIYNNLYGTDLGGRPSRKEHYKWSLLSLLKMTDAFFLCYTSENDIKELEQFFFEQYKIDKNLLEFKVFDIRNTKWKNLINSVKNVEEVKKSDRCFEIQYSKFHWWWDEDGSYDYYYWIDAGLSHNGLIPYKYLKDTPHYQKYFESPLFNNNFLNNLIKRTGDKFYLLAKENKKYYWSKTVDSKWYKTYNSDYHIIGGLFGGKKELWNNVVSKFEDYLCLIIKEDKTLFFEELIMSLMYVNHMELFDIDKFDIWWHENDLPNGLDASYTYDKKSFYKILEDLNNG